MSDEAPRRPKLITPEPESNRPKSQLLVPGSDGAPAPVEPATPEPEAVPEEAPAEEGGGMTVIDEDTGEVTSSTAPVKIQEMSPPPADAEPEAITEPVAEAAAAVEEAVEQVVETVAEAVDPAPVEEVVYEQAPAEQAYEQAPEQVAYEQPAYEQPAYEQPAYEQPPAADPAAYAPPPAAYDYGQAPQAGYAPPPAAPAYQQPPAAYAAPPVVQQQPVGAYGAAGMPLVGQSTGVPGWAMFLLGLLGGFLITLALFKFTPLAEGLRPDLIQYGKDLVKRETPSDPSASVKEDDTPAPTPVTTDEGGGGGAAPVEENGGDGATAPEEPTEGDEGG